MRMGVRVQKLTLLISLGSWPDHVLGRSVTESMIESVFGGTGSSLRLASQFQTAWEQVRARVVAPVLRAVIVVCLAMSVMLVVEAVGMAAVSIAVKVLRKKPEKRYKWEEMGGDDEEMGSLEYPMVLIQIPMYNEREVIIQFKEASYLVLCSLKWERNGV